MLCFVQLSDFSTLAFLQITTTCKGIALDARFESRLLPWAVILLLICLAVYVLLRDMDIVWPSFLGTWPCIPLSTLCSPKNKIVDYQERIDE